ncbi:extracellular solute-binding protein [Dactylosporangium sp. NPDC051541]|uniref:extracellular solute-binding protein n=1 Tax=Dactylosporangium sp. NPDC051541 TaxID=3363977 RepID=UPI0037B22393
MYLQRRSLFKLAGAGLIGAPLLAACGDGGGPADVSNANKDLVPWPAYVPFNGPKPDGPGTDTGVQPLYLSYPQQVKPSVSETVGDGSKVTAMVITFAAPPRPVGDNQFWQAVNKALNVELNVIVVPDAEYGQKMTTLMASGNDLPDIIMFTNLALPNALEFVQAKCADLSGHLGGDAVKQYPNIANIPPYAWKGMGRVGGRIYGVPLERPKPANSLFVNRTMLDQAGVPLEWNKDQYLEAMRRLTRDRKWGIGWSKTLFSGLGAITYHAGSLGAPNTWAESGGTFTHTIATPQFEQALDVMRQIVAAGAHYPDSLTASITDVKTQFANGSLASMSDGFGALALQSLTTINNRFELGLGRPYGPNATPWQGAGMFGFATFKKADDARIKLLLRIVNYLSAPFGSSEYELANYGVEGKHFTKDGNGIKTLPLYDSENSNLLPTRYIGTAPSVIYLPGFPAVAKSAYEWEKATMPKAVPDASVGLRSATLSAKGAQLNQIIGDGIAAVTFGRKDLAAWKDVVAQWRQAGGDQVAAELAKERQAAAN